MEEKRREELGLIVANFMGKAVTQKALDEFCNRIKIEKPELARQFEQLEAEMLKKSDESQDVRY